MNTINIDLNKQYTIVLTGNDIASILQGLGEIPHKIGGPLESKLITQIFSVENTSTKE